jgi:catechol 2,3-dioxygenase-like lactoylglutathione lyase family enzyme
MAAIHSAPRKIPLKGLNHVAWRCIDAEQTRQFYEDLLGLPLAHVIRSERVPSTGEYAPFCHLFFEMRDGSYIAFFDIRDGRGATLSSDMPKWVHHFAFEVDTIDEVRAIKERLERAGIEVLGVTDHHFVQSIYFFDPNGLRLEVTTRTETEEYMDDAKQKAHAALGEWTATKRSEKRAGGVA